VSTNDKHFGEQSVFVDSTNDLIVNDVIRTNEMQVWFLAEHVVETPLMRAE
jgi:starvation-inducible DNA-binding protein